MKKKIVALSVIAGLATFGAVMFATQPAMVRAEEAGSEEVSSEEISSELESSELESSELESSVLSEEPSIIESLESSEELVEEAPCKVVVSALKHGAIATDIAEGEIGTIVKLTVTPNNWYLLDWVKVNEVDLLPDENGNYAFALVEGENVISASFSLDPEIAGELSSILEEAKTGNWKAVFTVENLLLIINYVINSGVGLALVALFKKYKDGKTVDREDVINTLKDVIPTQAGDLIKGLVDDQLLPLLSKTIAKVSSMETAVSVFTNCLILLQNDDAESKIAIVEELKKINLGDANLADEVIDSLKGEIARIKEESANNKALLAALKEENAKALAQSHSEINALANNIDSEEVNKGLY